MGGSGRGSSGGRSRSARNKALTPDLDGPLIKRWINELLTNGLAKGLDNLVPEPINLDDDTSDIAKRLRQRGRQPQMSTEGAFILMGITLVSVALESLLLEPSATTPAGRQIQVNASDTNLALGNLLPHYDVNGPGTVPQKLGRLLGIAYDPYERPTITVTHADGSTEVRIGISGYETSHTLKAQKAEADRRINKAKQIDERQYLEAVEKYMKKLAEENTKTAAPPKPPQRKRKKKEDPSTWQ